MNNLENEIQNFKDKIITASTLIAALERTNNTIVDSRQKLNEIDLLINKIESSTKTIFDKNIQDQKILLETNEIKLSNSFENLHVKFEQTKNDLIKDNTKLLDKVEESEKNLISTTNSEIQKNLQLISENWKVELEQTKLNFDNLTNKIITNEETLVNEIKSSEEHLINKATNDYLDLINKTNLSLEKTLETLKSELEAYTNDIYSSERELIDKLEVDNKNLIDKTISDYKELIDKTSNSVNTSLERVCSELAKTTDSFMELVNSFNQTNLTIKDNFEEIKNLHAEISLKIDEVNSGVLDNTRTNEIFYASLVEKLEKNKKINQQNFYILIVFISILLFFVISMYLKY
jgi:hypothetical protein